MNKVHTLILGSLENMYCQAALEIYYNHLSVIYLTTHTDSLSSACFLLMSYHFLWNNAILFLEVNSDNIRGLSLYYWLGWYLIVAEQTINSKPSDIKMKSAVGNTKNYYRRYLIY